MSDPHYLGDRLTEILGTYQRNKHPSAGDRLRHITEVIELAEDNGYQRGIRTQVGIIAAIEERHAEAIAKLQDSLDHSIRREVSLKLNNDYLRETAGKHAEEIKQARIEAYEDAIRVASSWVGGYVRGDDAIRVLREKAGKL